MSYKGKLLTVINTLAFFKKYRVCEDGSVEVSEDWFAKKHPPIPWGKAVACLSREGA